LEIIIDTREHLQTELDLFQDKTLTIRDTTIISQGNMEAKIEAAHREFKVQLKEVEARVERGRGTRAWAGAAQPPTFDGAIFWAVFQCQFETVAIHNHCLHQEESTYLTTTLKGRAADSNKRDL
jgi:benzoyl-CoA reductase/2-hydroxyglutaryl-CoA dehydratase subunit BcrC/BadD/HgdB